MKINSLIIIIVIESLLFISTNQCHYSCLTCSDQLYTDCITCTDSSTPDKINSKNSTKVCINNMKQNANAFGIFLLLIVIITCVVLKSQQIYYFTLSFQTISLLYLLEVPWIFGVNYILSGLNYLMIFTRIQFVYKQNDNELITESNFKSAKLYKTANLVINMEIIGIINILLFILMIVIPIFKAFRKKINKQRVNCLPDQNLQTILLAVRTFFLMIIQQTVLTIYFSINNGKSQPANFIIAIIYFAILTYFVINQWRNPFPYFREKFAQLNTILSKIIIPIFMILASKNQFIVFIFMLLFILLDIIITNKNRMKKGLNRLFMYKIAGGVIVIGLMINYILDLRYNNLQTSKRFGYVTIALLCLFINAYILQIVLEGKEIYQSRISNRIDLEASKVVQENKNTTMVSIDNRQVSSESLDFNIHVLNFDCIQPHIDLSLKESFQQTKSIPLRQRMKQLKLDIQQQINKQIQSSASADKKQQLEFKSQLNSQKNREKPIIRFDNSTIIKVEQKKIDDSNLSEKGSIKLQDSPSVPSPISQNQSYKIKRKKFNVEILQ